MLHLRRLLIVGSKPGVFSLPNSCSWRPTPGMEEQASHKEMEPSRDAKENVTSSDGGGGTAERETTPEVESKKTEEPVPKVDGEAAEKDTATVDQRDPTPSPPKRGRMRRFLSNFVSFDRQSSDSDNSGEKVNYSELPLEKKRDYYKCGEDYLTLSDIPPWAENHKSFPRPKIKKSQKLEPFSVDEELCGKVSLWRGDITTLEIDAIVNAANSSLLGGGGVDGAIHTAAGKGLLRECRTLGGCKPGDAKLTLGHRLPAKYVVHTVGPMNNSKTVLQSCYQRCLQLALSNNIRSLAFPCIATGVYGFPNDKAAEMALVTTRKWLQENREKVDRIIFCVFLDVDYKIYCKYLPLVYPVESPVIQDSQEHVSGTTEEDNPPLKPAMIKSHSAPAPATKSASPSGKVAHNVSANASSVPPGSGAPANAPPTDSKEASSSSAKVGENSEGSGEGGEGGEDVDNEMEVEEQGDKDSVENRSGEDKEKEKLKTAEGDREKGEDTVIAGDGDKEKGRGPKDPGFE